MANIKVRVFDKYINKFIERGQKDKTVKKCFDFTSRKEMELLQDQFLFVLYTGLRDKNGEEIHEGNLTWDSHKEVIGRIVFDEGKFLYEWENISEDLREVCDEIEVIGSVYENPELLEV